MTKAIFLQICFLLTAFTGEGYSAEKKVKFLVVSSYHKGYAWSQQTNIGFCRAMQAYGYFESEEQAKEFSDNDFLENSRVVVKKVWMDTKRKKSKTDIKETVALVKKAVRSFQPDLIFLGDDNAARYIGKAFLGSPIPIVFWGVNITPIKYGLANSIQTPGHNVTGVYQVGYYEESINFLKKIVPSAKTFAILGDNSISSQAHSRAVRSLARHKKIPFTLNHVVNTDNYDLFKKKALE
ncbi:MAG: ABC transporter substrate-binding protein [Nitrospinota bacterium]